MDNKLIKTVVGALLATPLYAWADPATLLILAGQFIATAGPVAGAYFGTGMALVAAGVIYGSVSKRRAAKKAATEAKNAYNSQLEDRGATILSAVPPWRIVYGRATIGGSIHAMFTADKVKTVNGQQVTRKDALHYLVYVFAAHEVGALHNVFIDNTPAGPFDADGYSLNSEFRSSESMMMAGQVSLDIGASWTSDKPVLSFTAIGHPTDYVPEWGQAHDVTGYITVTNGGRTLTNNSTMISTVSYQMYSVMDSSFRFIWHDGDPNQTVDGPLHSAFPDKWTTNHRIRGRAYAVVVVDLEDSRFQSGPPSITVDVTGKLVYDPRNASTTASNNVALCIRDFLLAKYGANADTTEVNDTYVAAAANACDAWISVDVPGYLDTITYTFAATVDGWVGSNATLTQNSGTPTFLRVACTAEDTVAYKEGLSFSGSTNRYVRFRMRRNAGDGWVGKLYYKTAGHGYSEDYRKDFNTGFPVGGDWVELVYDMHSLTTGAGDWKGSTITGLQFRFGIEAGDVFDIDWISVSEFAPDTELQPKYTMNGAFTTDDSRESVLENMAVAMNGYVTNGGQWLVVAGAWTAPVRDFTDDDLDGQIAIVQTDTGLDELANSSKGTYYPVGVSSPVEFPPYKNATLVTNDGEELWEDINLPYTNSETRARNVARVRVERTRSGQILTVPLKLHAWPTQVGDRIRLTSTEYGLNLKVYRVTDWGFSVTGAVVLTVQEDAEEIYDEADTTLSDPTPNTDLPNPNIVQNVENLLAASGTDHLTVASDGTITTRVFVSWDAARDAYLVAGSAYAEIKWRRVLFDPVDQWNMSRVPATSVSVYIENAVEFEFLVIGVRYVNSVGREGAWSFVEHTVIGKSEPPDAVTGLAYTNTAGGMRISWDPCIEVDYAETELRYGASWAAGVLVWVGKANEALWIPPGEGDYTIWAVHRDTTGHESTPASLAVNYDASGITSAQTMVLSADRLAFVFADENAATAITTDDITLTAKLQNLVGAVSFSAVAYNSAGTSLGAVTLTGTSDTVRVLTAANFVAPGLTVAYVEVTAEIASTNGSGTLDDTTTIYRVNHGSNSVYVILTNDSHTIPTNSDGTNGVYTGSGTDIGVFEGTNQLVWDNVGTTPGKWKVVASGGGTITPGAISAAGNNARVAQHAGMTNYTAIVTYTITGKTLTGEAFTHTKLQTLSKAIAGNSSALLTLDFSGVAFVFQGEDGNVSTTPNITLTALLNNITGTATFTTAAYDIGGGLLGTGTPLGGSGNTRTLTPAQFLTYPTTYTLKITATLDALTDTITIYRVNDGADTMQVGLSNEAHLIPSANDGTVESYSGASGSMVAAKGGLLLSNVTDPSVSFSMVGYTGFNTVYPAAQAGITINATTGFYSVTAGMTADVATVTFRATLSNGFTADRVFSLAKSKEGAAGSAAVSIDLLSESDITAANSDGTGYVLPANNQIKLYEGGVLLVAGVTYAGDITKNGLTANVNESTGIVTFTGSTPTWTSNAESFTFQATYNSITYSANYTYAKSKAGSDAVNADLLSEADVVAAAADGTGYVLPTGNEFKLYKGGTDLTSGVAYSVWNTGTATWLASTTKNGLTFAIDASTGVITLSGASWTSDSEVFTTKAVYGGLDYSKLYSIAKSKRGETGEAGGVVLTLQATAAAYVFESPDATSSTTPAITLTGLRGTLVGTMTFTTQAFNAAGTSLGTGTPLSGSGDTRTMTATQFLFYPTARYVTITATVGAYSDTFTLYRIDHGSDTITAGLSNESHIVPADPAGVVSSWVGAGGSMVVLKGVDILSSVTTPSVAFSLVGYTGFSTTYPTAQAGISVNTTTGAYSVSNNVTSDVATVTIRATLSTGLTLDRIFTVTKARQGIDGDGGVAAQLLTIGATGLAFIFADKNATLATEPENIVFTATLQNVSGTVVFAGTAYNAAGTMVGSAGGVTLTGTGNTRTLSKANFNAAGATVQYVVVTATLGSLSDTTTVYRGDHGSSVVQILMSNEAHTLPAANDGTVSSYVGSGTAIGIFEGTTQLDYDGIGTAAGKWTASRSVTTGTMTTPGALSESGALAIMADHAGMTADLVQVTVTATGKTLTGASFSISKVQSLTKSRQGTAGVTGTRTAVLEMYKWAASQPVSSFPAGTSTYTWATGQFTDPATPNSWTRVPGAAVAGQTLWVVRQVYADQLTSATSDVTWAATSSAASGAAGTSGTDGQRVGFLEVYKWALAQPVSSFPAGTSTYTWADGSFTAPSTANGWALVPGAPTAGYTLWACSVRVSNNSTSATSSATWNTAVSYAVGFAGSDGGPGDTGQSNHRVYRAVTIGAAKLTPANTTNGATPTSPAVWSAVPLTLTAGQEQYQSDGTTPAGSTTTTWTVEYPSYLKVGTLEAITGNMGTLTAGSINTTGYLRAEGSTGVTVPVSGASASRTTAGAFNTTNAQQIGVIATNNNSTNPALYGWNASVASGIGVYGQGAIGVVGIANAANGDYGAIFYGNGSPTYATVALSASINNSNAGSKALEVFGDTSASQIAMDVAGAVVFKGANGGSLRLKPTNGALYRGVIHSVSSTTYSLGVTASGTADGAAATTPLSINLSTGAFTFSAAPSFQSNFTVGSTTLVSSLNADLLDGQHGSYYAAASSVPAAANNGTLTMGVSGVGLSGSASFTANQSGSGTFTVTSNATSANTANAIVSRNANGDVWVRDANMAGTISLNGATVSSLGGGIPTFSTKKPGADTVNTWLQVYVNGVFYQIPMWPNS